MELISFGLSIVSIVKLTRELVDYVSSVKNCWRIRGEPSAISLCGLLEQLKKRVDKASNGKEQLQTVRLLNVPYESLKRCLEALNKIPSGYTGTTTFPQRAMSAICWNSQRKI
jgi:hypothetical protein